MSIKKSEEERKQIKLMKSIHKEKLKGTFFTPKEETIYLPLIVYTKQSKVENYKSTHSFKCFKSDVNDILNDLRIKGYILNKVYFNSKPYKYE